MRLIFNAVQTSIVLPLDSAADSFPKWWRWAPMQCEL